MVAKSADFPSVFKQLKAILEPLAPSMIVQIDAPDNYYLDTKVVMTNKKPAYFGSVQIKKNYVSFHLMAIYMFPDLLDNCSTALKKRMQGKSCFNFTTVDEALFAELADLVQRGIDRFRREFTGETSEIKI